MREEFIKEATFSRIGEIMRRGISPVIAAVLLVIISVAAGVLVWTWISGFAARNPTTQPALEERIRIEAVGIYGSGGTYNITVYVRNIGSKLVNITSVYIIDANGSVVFSNTTLNVGIAPGEVKGISVDTNVSLKSGYSYIVKVVTLNGAEAVYRFSAP